MKKNIDALFGYLEEIMGGYRGSQILFTANRLNLFDALRDKPKTIEDLSGQLRANMRALQILCNALVGLDLLKKRGNVYSLTRLAEKYLLEDSPYSQKGLLRHGAALYERWGKLYDVVKTGRPVSRDAISPELQGDEQTFAEAMASSARMFAMETAQSIDLKHAKTLLDIGGGPALYAIEFLKVNPTLKVTVLDNAKTLAVAKKYVEKAGLVKQIELVPGDALTDEIPGSYDVVFMSNVIHQYSFDENAELIKRAAKVLNCSGNIYVKDFLLEPCRTKPVKASLFAVNMLVDTERGNCYTVNDVKSWYRGAGIVPKSTIDLYPPSRIVVGKKKSG